MSIFLLLTLVWSHTGIFCRLLLRVCKAWPAIRRHCVGSLVWLSHLFFDCLSYFEQEITPFTGRAQGVDLAGNVTAEGFFIEGRPEGRWTRWHANGLKREEFLITNGECCYARHWDENGSPN